MTSVIFLRTKDGLISGSDTKSSDAHGDLSTPYGIGYSKVGKFNGLRYGHSGNAGIGFILDFAASKHKEYYAEMTNRDLYNMVEFIVSEAKRIYKPDFIKEHPMASDIVFVGASGYVHFRIDNELNIVGDIKDWEELRMPVIALGSGNPTILKYMRANLGKGRVTGKELVRRALQSAKSKDSGTGGELIVRDWVEETTEYNKPKKLHFVTWFEIYVWLFNQIKQAVTQLITVVALMIKSIDLSNEKTLAKLKLTG